MLEKELFDAIIEGNEEKVRGLLEQEQGANPNAADENDWTVLHEACSRAHIGIIRLLLEKGANVNAVYSEGQTLDKIENITPLYLLCKKLGNSKSIIRLLWEHGAEVTGFNVLCFWNLLFSLRDYDNMDLNSMELDLSFRGVGDKELKQLATALQSKYFTNVTKLKLMGNHFSDDGLIFLASALKKNRLESLDLSFNDIGSRWLLPSGIKYLIDGLNYNQKMESLNLIGCRLNKSEKQLLNAFWQPKQHYMIVNGLDSLSELKKINSNNNQEAKENYESKYQQQESKNKIYKIAIGVLAIILTPVSLLLTLPMYFYSKRNTDIQKLEISQETYDEVKEKKRLLKQYTNYKVEKDDQKPKKVFMNQNEKNKFVYLVDKSQLARFKLFSKHNLGYLKDNAEKIANQVQHSRAESKNIFLKSNG